MNKIFEGNPELKAAYEAAIREEKRLLKQRVRAAIARKDRNWVFAYCCGQRADYRRMVEETFLFGRSSYITSEKSAEWVLRYTRRLGVPFI